MTSRLLALFIAVTPSAALAHPGHVAESSGHTHWLALVILGALGLALAGWGLARFARAVKRRGRA